MTARTATLAIAGLLLAGGATFILGQRDQRLVTCRNAMAQIAGAMDRRERLGLVEPRKESRRLFAKSRYPSRWWRSRAYAAV